MEINRNNYEAYLLDLMEGRLSAEEERVLKEFLKMHPELVVDLPDIDLLILEKQCITFPGKDQLKKEFPVEDTELSETNFDIFSIARMEGDLSARQEQEHRSLLARDTEKQKEWQAWQNTVLVPEQLAYPGKKSLKRKKTPLTRRLWISGFAAAAALALVFLVFRTGLVEPGLTELPQLSQEITEQLIEAEPQEVSPIELTLESQEESQNPPQIQAQPVKAVENIEISPETAAIVAQELMPENQAEIKARPIRLAENFASTSAPVGNAGTDRIESLHLAPISAKTSRLPLNEIGELDRQILFEGFTKEKNITLMSVANAGIKGINRLTGSDISLMASRDDEGDVSGFRLKSKRLSVTRPLNRE